MKTVIALAVLGGMLGQADAEETQLKCSVLTTFHKAWIGDTQWSHVEKRITKYFLINSDAQRVSVYNDRQGAFVPVCSEKNKACVVRWSDSTISVDATQGPDNPIPPHLDFRRAITLTDHATKVRFVIADFGESKSGKENMDWTYEGDCTKSDTKLAHGPGAGPGAPAPTFIDARAMPVSEAERNQAWASRRGNTTTGLSAGGRSWFHMWFFDNGIAYTGDGDDISNEGVTRQWYIGKTSAGDYRLCETPVPAEGEMGCYPFPSVKLNDIWTEQDVYGPAVFTLLPGRQ